MKKIESLDEMRKIELDIMKRVHQFCVEHRINYFLCCGTLIGAIRHNGYIPWDDDIDIYMPRPDYKKFCREFPQYAEKVNLQIVNHKTKPYYGRAMSKVIDLRTYLEEPDFKGDDPIGVFIDVWPLDGCFKSNIREKIHKGTAGLFRELLCRKIDADTSRQKLLSKMLLSFLNKKFLVEMLEKSVSMCNYNSAEKVRCYVDPYRVAYDKMDYTPILHQFEDTNFYIPQGYDAILRATYGDYMQLPPKEKQVPHHVVNTYWK